MFRQCKAVDYFSNETAHSRIESGSIHTQKKNLDRNSGIKDIFQFVSISSSTISAQWYDQFKILKTRAAVLFICIVKMCIAANYMND